VDRHALNKRTVEGLIKAGAMDNLPGTRRQKLAILDQALSAGIDAQKAREAGQVTMFDMMGGGSEAADAGVSSIPLPLLNETPEQQKEQLAWEKELLGMYISAHPIVQALKGIDTSGTLRLSEITAEIVGKTQTFIGMLTGLRRISTKKGDTMLVASLEDLESTIELVVFPKTLEQYSDLLQDDAVLQITAKVDNRRDTLQLIVESCASLDTLARTDATAVVQPEMDIEGRGEEEEAVPEPDALPAAPEPHSADGAAPAATAPQPVVPPPQSPVATPAPTVIRARTKVSLDSDAGNGNGNGNGHEHGYADNGSGESYQPPTRCLHLYLPRTGDFDADVGLMQAADSLLRSYEGADRVQLYLPNGIGTVVLRPRYTVNLSPALVEELERMVGSEGVAVEG
jgi:DNA polymerase-3 subunit alpha